MQADPRPLHLHDPYTLSTTATQTQLAHQLAAETLLTMAPSKSPEARTESITSTRPEDANRGVKRKSDAEHRAAPSPVAPAAQIPSDQAQLLRGHVPPPTTSAQTTQARPPQNGTTSTQAAQTTPAGQPTNRYSIYGPTSREPGNSPWNSFSQRYPGMPVRRDPAVPSPVPTAAATPTAAKPATPSAAQLDPPRRPSPDPARDRFYPPAMGGYSHYSMGRRELQEHREQLREGKRWLDGMLVRTEKLLSMVENKLSLAGEAQVRKDEPDYEERERARQREMRRIEEEREKDRQEREKRERERLASLAGFGGLFGRDRPFHMAESRTASSSSSAPQKSEAERNRDLLLASRKVSAISPADREREKEREREQAKDGVDKDKKPGWNGEPVLGGTTVPRRDQGLGRGFGRGLWSFDVRG
jgi:GATA-binding protein